METFNHFEASFKDGPFVRAEEAYAEIERLRAELADAKADALAEGKSKLRERGARIAQESATQSLQLEVLRLAKGLAAANAEVERLRAEQTWSEAHVTELRTQLSAANALLAGKFADASHARIAYLAGQPAAPSRTAAEQAVLSACLEIPDTDINAMCGLRRYRVGVLVSAILALREASK